MTVVQLATSNGPVLHVLRHMHTAAVYSIKNNIEKDRHGINHLGSLTDILTDIISAHWYINTMKN